MNNGFYPNGGGDYNFFQNQNLTRNYQSGGFDFGPDAVERIFGNINQTVRGVKDVINTIADDSRRNNNYPPQQYYSGYSDYPRYNSGYGNGGYSPNNGIVGYGWGDIPMAAFASQNSYTGTGYPGIWNPAYGNGGNYK
jgi:hypothetical protein